MAELWEEVKRNMRDFISPDITESEAAIIVIAAATTFLCLLGMWKLSIIIIIMTSYFILCLV